MPTTAPLVTPAASPVGVELYWLPLGAGGWFVRLNGRIWQAVHARLEHRRPQARHPDHQPAPLTGRPAPSPMSPRRGGVPRQGSRAAIRVSATQRP